MGAPPTPRDGAAVLREQLRRRGVSLTLTAEGQLKAAPRTVLTDDDRAAIGALRDELVAVVRDGDERPARILALAAELGWPERRPFVGQSVGPGEADYRRVLESPSWSQMPDGAEQRELLLGALAGVLAHQRGRADTEAGADEGRPIGRRRGHLRLLPLHDAADDAAAEKSPA